MGTGLGLVTAPVLWCPLSALGAAPCPQCWVWGGSPGVTLGQLGWPWHPQLLPGLSEWLGAALPPLPGCVRMSRHKLWGFLGRQEQDEPCEPPQALFVLCGSSNGLEIAASMAESSSATQMCAEPYWGRLIPSEKPFTNGKIESVNR